MILVYVLLGAAILVGIYVVSVYNSLVNIKNLVKEAWSSIDVQLKRRYDLIPNVVETVKGYATHEKELFERVSEMRAKTVSSGSTQKEKIESENALSAQLRTVFAVAENYPELKANQNFMDLQRQLADIEEQIQFARRYYNGVVRDYNIRIQSFPSNIVASMFKYETLEYFEMESVNERNNPEVKF